MFSGRYFHQLLRHQPHDFGRRTLTALVATSTRLGNEIFPPCPTPAFASTQKDHELITRRYFAKGKKVTNVDLPLANEKLVLDLIKRSKAASAEELQVRVRDTDAKTYVVSLKDAINMSLAAHSDLVALAIDQEVPVVAISDLGNIAYQENKKAAKQQNGNLAVKEVTFKVGIANNDFQRKLDSVTKFLDKGHSCNVTVKDLRRHMQTNETIAEEVAKKILNLLSDRSEVQKTLQMNEQKTTAQFQLRPKKKKATQQN